MVCGLVAVKGPTHSRSVAAVGMRVNRCDAHRFAQPLEQYAQGVMTGREMVHEVLCQAMYLSTVLAEDLLTKVLLPHRR